MKILIDINHPAHIHLFKNFSKILINHNHEVLFTIKDKDVTSLLLKSMDFNFINFGKPYASHIKKAIGLIKFDYLLYKAAKKFNPDIIISHMSIYAAHISFLLGKPHVTLTDSEHISRKQKHMNPMNHTILTPSCFRGNLGCKQVKYNGYHEIAYLHPNYFIPDGSILNDLKIKKDEKFFIVRKTAGWAVENIGQKLMGNDELSKLIDYLKVRGKVILSAEGKIDKKLEKYIVKIKPEKIHSLMYYANLFIGDSLTMFTEAALLGTPSFSISSEGFLLGNFDEICEKYKLGFRFRSLTEALCKIEEIVEDENIKAKWAKKKEILFADKIDVTQFLVDFIENYNISDIKESKKC